MENLEELVRNAQQKHTDMPFLQDWQQKHRQKPIEEIVRRLEYGYDQYWTIVGILANYPTLQKDDDISNTIKRVVDLLCTVQQENEYLRNKLEDR